MSAHVLREAAKQMREDYQPRSNAGEHYDAHSRFHLAVADLLDDAAENDELLRPGGDLGPVHDGMMRWLSHDKACRVARVYLGIEPTDG